MLFNRAKTSMPTPEEALPGRAERPCARRAAPRARRAAGHRRGARGLRGRAVRARLLLGCRGDLLAGAGRLVDVRRVRRRHHAEPVVRRGLLAAAPGTPRPCAWSTTRRRCRTPTWSDLLEVHDPTQGYRQGNDVGTQYRSAIYSRRPEQEKIAREVTEALPARADPARLRPDHHRDQAGRRDAVLLRRGPAPAVPAEEPVRLPLPLGHRDPGPAGLSRG